MNLRTGIMALTMATTAVAGHAQQAAKTMTRNDSIAHVVQRAVANKVDSASTLAFSEAQKMMGTSKKVPKGMVKVTRESGKFVGKVTPQGLNGDLTYSTSSRMVRDPKAAPAVKVTYGARYLHSQNLRHAGLAEASVEKGKTYVTGQMYLGKKRDDVKGGLKLFLGQDYKLGKGFTLGPQVGLHTDMEKIRTAKIPQGDLKGRFAPELSIIGKYKHEFDNGVRVGAHVGMGGAARLGYNNRSTHVGSIVDTYKAGASVGFKGADLVVTGGKDVHLGNNVSAGIRFTF